MESYSDTGLTASGEFSYRVWILVGAEKSRYSNAVRVKVGTLPTAPKGPQKSAFELLMGSGLFWVTALAFLFYVPLESCTAGWATTLIVSQGAPGTEEQTRKIAARGLSAFWLCFMGSRLLV